MRMCVRMKVLFDTNVLLALMDEKLDFVSELEKEHPEAEGCVLRQSLMEVKAMRPQAFDAILAYLQKNKVQIVYGDGKADDLIEEWAVKEKGAVATFDFGLKKRLKKAGVQIITLKKP